MASSASNGAMKIAESFNLPELSDDEDDENCLMLSRESVAGRSMTAAARSPTGTPMLTDGFGMYTSAVGGLRTARKEINVSNPAGTRTKPSSANETKVTKIATIDPNSLPPQLLGPVGKGPPFVWNPNQFDSIEDSQIRTVSILSQEALSSCLFANPKQATNKPQPRISSNSSRVLGNSYGGTGKYSPRQLSPSEYDDVSRNRGTAFSPFCIQKGKPRPNDIIHDSPFDNSGKNVVQNKIWRTFGGKCDRTKLDTTKQGHRARTAPHFIAAEQARARGYTTRGVSSPRNTECNNKYALADGNGVLGGAGRRGGTYQDVYQDPRDYSNTCGVKPIQPKEGESLIQFGDIDSTAQGSQYLQGSTGQTSPTNRQSKASAHVSARRQLKDSEYVIHEDPLVRLDPKVIQLLNEKSIVGRLFPPERLDIRISVKERFATRSDKFCDSNVIGTKALGDRHMSQGLDSMKVMHPADQIDCLDVNSIVQKERIGNTFPTAPWDGTMKNIAATDIGLWRDPGWDIQESRKASGVGNVKFNTRSKKSPLQRNSSLMFS